MLGSLGIHAGLIAAAFSITWVDSNPRGSESDASARDGTDFEMASPARESPVNQTKATTGSAPVLPARPLLAVSERTAAINLPPIEPMFQDTAKTESSPPPPTATAASGPLESSGQDAGPSARRAAKSAGRKGGEHGQVASRKKPLTPPRLLHAPPPHYPSQAKNIGKAGKASVLIRVRADGSAAAASLYHSSGSSQLDQAAVEAARAWTFSKTPELGSGETFAVVVQVTFTL